MRLNFQKIKQEGRKATKKRKSYEEESDQHVSTPPSIQTIGIRKSPNPPAITGKERSKKHQNLPNRDA
jgi:hypothetical protein